MMRPVEIDDKVPFLAGVPGGMCRIFHRGGGDVAAYIDREALEAFIRSKTRGEHDKSFPRGKLDWNLLF